MYETQKCFLPSLRMDATPCCRVFFLKKYVPVSNVVAWDPCRVKRSNDHHQIIHTSTELAWILTLLLTHVMYMGCSLET